MTARSGEGTYGDGVGVVTPLAHKLSQNGPLVRDSTGRVRSGVFYAGTTSLVSGKANMSYDVAAFEAAVSRGRAKGTSFPTNDGVVNVATTTAPASNSRYDVIYVQQREVSEGDPDSSAVIGVVQGAAAAVPVVPSIPSGAIELGRALVGAGITATTAATITQTAPFTTVSGTPIPARSKAAVDAITGYPVGTLAQDLSTGATYRFDGSSWQKTGLIASGTLSAVSSFNIDGLTGYTEYEIVLDLPVSSVANAISAVLRSGGVANTSANYDSQRDTGADSATAAASVFGANSWASLAVTERTDKLIRLQINGLNEARRTMVEATSLAFNATNQGIRNGSSLRHRVASAFDGVGFTVSAGTVSGTYEVYAR